MYKSTKINDELIEKLYLKINNPYSNTILPLYIFLALPKVTL